MPTQENLNPTNDLNFPIKGNPVRLSMTNRSGANEEITCFRHVMCIKVRVKPIFFVTLNIVVGGVKLILAGNEEKNGETTNYVETRR